MTKQHAGNHSPNHMATQSPNHPTKPTTYRPGLVLRSNLDELAAISMEVGANIAFLPEGDFTLRVTGPAIVILATSLHSDNDSFL
jgi:hypothetical protein